MRRYQMLPMGQRGIILLALFAMALTGGISYIALALAFALSARRSWRERRGGLVRVVRAGVTPGLVFTVAAHVGWRLALAWANRMVDDGRGQFWLARIDERLERWVTESENRRVLSAED